MATQITPLVTLQLPPITAQPDLENALPAKAKQESLNFGKFRADLAMLHLLPPEELERRWLEVQRKNEDKLARGLHVNPYDR